MHQLACALARRGLDVHVLFSREPDERVDVEVPYRIHWVRRFPFATVNLDIFSFAQALRDLLRRERFDLVHGHAEESFFFPRLCARTGTRFLFTSHAPFIPAAGGFGALRHPVRFLKQVNPHLLRAAAAGADAIVCFSEFSRRLVVKGLGAEWADRVAVLPPGVDPRWCERDRDPDPQPHLLFWGRMEDEKGVPELLRAMAVVLRQVPEAHLTLVGEGHRLADYIELANDLEISGNVTFAGWQSGETLRQLAARARLGVFPSRVESFGLAVAEALAAGLPLIAGWAGALPELVEDGKTGLLVPARDPDTLAQTLLNALDNETWMNRLGQNAREAARKTLSWDAAAETWVDFYRRQGETPKPAPRSGR